MTRLVWRADGVTVKAYGLQPGLNRVGRAAGNEVRIDDGSISARHCEIWVDDDSLRIRDLGSTNGTYLDDTPVSEAEFRWGQMLRLGGIELAVQDPPVKVAIPAAPVSEGPPRFLPDGQTPCCPNHTDAAAAYLCTQCATHWCTECTRRLRRLGGRILIFCPGCGAPCEGFSPDAPKQRPPPRVVYWLDRLADNFRPRPKYARRRPRAD